LRWPLRLDRCIARRSYRRLRGWFAFQRWPPSCSACP
jgi:hypothetical protein